MVIKCPTYIFVYFLSPQSLYTFRDYDRLNYPGVLKNDNLEAIIKCHQELDLDFVNGNDVWLDDEDKKILDKNASPNVVNLNLNNHDVNNDNSFRLLLIKVLILQKTLITSDSLETIRQYLNLTLEELSLAYYDYVCFTGIIELTFMTRFRLQDYKCISSKGVESQNIRQHLPPLMIRTFFDI